MSAEQHQPLAEISDLSHRVRRLHWFRQSFDHDVKALGRRFGLTFSIDEHLLVEAFFKWAKAFERERKASSRNRRDFAVYAGGLMLRQLLISNPTKVANQGQFYHLIPPDPMAKICQFWPEGFLYTTYCLNLVRAILKQDFHVNISDNAQVKDLRVWQSFRENFNENSSLAVSFFDVFMGVKPNWEFPESFLGRPNPEVNAISNQSSD